MATTYNSPMKCMLEDTRNQLQYEQARLVRERDEILSRKVPIDLAFIQKFKTGPAQRIREFMGQGRLRQIHYELQSSQDVIDEIEKKLANEYQLCDDIQASGSMQTTKGHASAFEKAMKRKSSGGRGNAIIKRNKPAGSISQQLTITDWATI